MPPVVQPSMKQAYQATVATHWSTCTQSLLIGCHVVASGYGCLVFGDLRTWMAASRSKRIRRRQARTKLLDRPPYTANFSPLFHQLILHLHHPLITSPSPIPISFIVRRSLYLYSFTQQLPYTMLSSRFMRNVSRVASQNLLSRHR